MQDRLRLADSSRMRCDIEAAIERLPGLASLALWCKFADTNENVTAYTDGSTIYAGADYAKRAPKERRFILLHEILHVALCHAQRFAEIGKRDGAAFQPKLLDIAADAIINPSLAGLSGLETPADAWTLEEIWLALEQSDSADSSSQNVFSAGYSFSAPQPPKKTANLAKSEFVLVNRWSCEELYYFLRAQAAKRVGFLEILIELDAKNSLGQDLRETNSTSSEDKSRLKQNNDEQCDAAKEMREWRERLILLHGSMPQLLQRLACELPRVETPWERVLREIVQTAFQESVKTDYSRPARRWLALEKSYQTSANVPLPFMPATRKVPAARLAVALDTSGSIDGELLNRFLAEIVALCQPNQRDLILIIGDAAVHSIVEIDWRNAEEQLRKIKYTGGGGTDFRPLIAAAAKREPDALVYLTDLYGETGDAPDFPVIWACAPETSAIAPWGEQIKLK